MELACGIAAGEVRQRQLPSGLQVCRARHQSRMGSGQLSRGCKVFWELDLTAIANVLRHTGPIADSPFGPLNAGNLVQTLLIDSYREFASDQEARQVANQILVREMLKRLNFRILDLLSVLRALGESAPGRHVQIYDATPKPRGAAQHARS